MKILGYLLVVALFGGNNKPLFEKVKDNYKIEFQKVGQLVQNLFKNNATDGPIFTREDLLRGNLVNKGTVAKYYSKTVRDYIIHHNISAEEEGFVLTLEKFKDKTGTDRPEDKECKYKKKTPTVIYIPKEGADVNDVENKELSSAISGYIDSVQKKIDSGQIGVAKELIKKDILEVDIENNNISVRPANKKETAYVAINKLNVQKPSELKVKGIENNSAEGSPLEKNNTLAFNQSITNNEKSAQEENQLGIKFEMKKKLKEPKITEYNNLSGNNLTNQSNKHKPNPEEINENGKTQFEENLKQNPHELFEKHKVNMPKHTNLNVNTNDFENKTNSTRHNNGLSQEIDKLNVYENIKAQKGVSSTKVNNNKVVKIIETPSPDIYDKIEDCTPKLDSEVSVDEFEDKTNTGEENFGNPEENHEFSEIKDVDKINEIMKSPNTLLNSKENTVDHGGLKHQDKSTLKLNNLKPEKIKKLHNNTPILANEKKEDNEQKEGKERGQYSNVRESFDSKHKQELNINEIGNRNNMIEQNFRIPEEKIKLNELKSCTKNEKTFKPMIDINKPNKSTITKFKGEPKPLTSNFNDNVSSDKTKEDEENNKVPQEGNYRNVKDRKVVQPDEKLSFDWTKWESYLKDNNSTKGEEETGDNKENANSQEKNPKKDTIDSGETTLTSNFNDNVFGDKINKNEENDSVPQKGNTPNVIDRKVVKPEDKLAFDWTKWESYLKDNNLTKGEEETDDNEENANSQENNPQKDTNDSQVYSGETTLTINFNDNVSNDDEIIKDEENDNVPQKGNTPNVKDRKVVKPEDKLAFDWTKWESYLKDNNSPRAEEGIGKNGENANSQKENPKKESNDFQVYGDETMKLERKQNTTTVLTTSNQLNVGTNNAVDHKDNPNKEDILKVPHVIKEDSFNLKNENVFQKKWDVNESNENDENYSDSEEDWRPVLEILDDDELDRAKKESYYIEVNTSLDYGTTSEENKS